MIVPNMDPNQSAMFLLFLFFLPPLIAVVKQAGLSSAMNALIAQLAYVIVGIGAALWSGIPLTFENAIPLITIATVVGQAAYKIIWSNLGGETSVDQAITAKTSFIKEGGDGSAPGS